MTRIGPIKEPKELTPAQYAAKVNKTGVLMTNLLMDLVQNDELWAEVEPLIVVGSLELLQNYLNEMLGPVDIAAIGAEEEIYAGLRVNPIITEMIAKGALKTVGIPEES